MSGMHLHFQHPFALRATHSTFLYRALWVCPAEDSEGKQGGHRRLADSLSACGRCDDSFSCAVLILSYENLVPVAEVKLETWMHINRERLWMVLESYKMARLDIPTVAD